MNILKLNDPENICSLLLCSPVKRRVVFEYHGNCAALAVCMAIPTDGGFGPHIAVAYACGQISYPGRVLAVKIERQLESDSDELKAAMEDEALEALKAEILKSE
jgi:hypothetical protein